jgi:uncharacterized RDD family membrane protein YckC
MAVAFPLSADALLGWVLLPAAAFALLYYPITKLIATGLVSPYAKADLGKRIGAGIVDGMLMVTSAALYQRFDTIAFVIVGAIYLLVRDMRGQSVGKIMFGLTVIDLENGKPATLRASIRRNIMLIVPGVNLAAVVLEFRAIVRDPQGQRLGDRLAQTQVVDGLDVKDLATEFIEWLNSLGGDVAGRRRRVRSS